MYKITINNTFSIVCSLNIQTNFSRSDSPILEELEVSTNNN